MLFFSNKHLVSSPLYEFRRFFLLFSFCLVLFDYFVGAWYLRCYLVALLVSCCGEGSGAGELPVRVWCTTKPCVPCTVTIRLLTTQNTCESLKEYRWINKRSCVGIACITESKHEVSLCIVYCKTCVSLANICRIIEVFVYTDKES